MIFSKFQSTTIFLKAPQPLAFLHDDKKLMIKRLTKTPVDLKNSPQNRDQGVCPRIYRHIFGVFFPICVEPICEDRFHLPCLRVRVVLGRGAPPKRLPLEAGTLDLRRVLSVRLSANSTTAVGFNMLKSREETVSKHHRTAVARGQFLYNYLHSSGTRTFLMLV